jgi:hypothetical protein
MTVQDQNTPRTNDDICNTLGNLGASSRSTEDIACLHSQPSTEQGIGLLVGSPIGDDTVCDTEILDYDSDEACAPPHGALVSSEPAPTAMDAGNATASVVEPEPQEAENFGWSQRRNIEVSAPAPGQLKYFEIE